MSKLKKKLLGLIQKLKRAIATPTPPPHNSGIKEVERWTNEGGH